MWDELYGWVPNSLMSGLSPISDADLAMRLNIDLGTDSGQRLLSAARSYMNMGATLDQVIPLFQQNTSGTNPMQDYSNVGTAPDQLASISGGTLRADGTLGFSGPEYDSGLRESTWGLPGGIELDTHDLAQIAMLVTGVGAATGAGFAGGAGGSTAGTAGAIAADGLSPITVGAETLAGGVPAVDAAAAAAWGGSIPSMASFPSLSGLSGTAAAGPILDSSGVAIPGTETVAGGGGGMWENLLGGMSGNWGALIGGLLGAIDARNQPDSMTTNQGGTSSSIYGQMLPNEIAAPATQALASFQDLFNSGSGYNVAGVNPVTDAAISRLQNLGSNPFATGAGINPYLDSVFNTAADSTQNRLASEFAHAGRLNTGSHQQARSQELQNLAAGIYAPGYEAERSRQYGAIESNLGRDFASVLPMLSAGDYLRSIQQQQYDAPMTSFNRYLSGLQGLLPFFPGTQTQSTEQTGSVTQPLFSNPLAGALGGAQLGSLFTRG